jgi:RNA polymerase-binding transcription factor DksA
MKKNEKRTRYSDEELLEFRFLIEEKLEKAKKQMDFYLMQLGEMNENQESKIKGLDDGIGTVEVERINTLAARQRKHIQHLENALLRIENKVYGICRVSGNLISKERLKAVPHATLSINAKQAR